MLEDEIPEISPPSLGVGLISYFWDMRQFKSSAEDRLSLGDIYNWQSHTSVYLDRWERDCIIAMDRALGSSTVEMLKFHQENVSIIKRKDKNRDRLSNGRRS